VKAANAQASKHIFMQQEIAHCPPDPPAVQTSASCASEASEDQSRLSFKMAEKLEVADQDEDGGWLEVTMGFSRQTTQEGIEPPLCFARRATSEDAWDDSTSASGSDAAEGSLNSEAEAAHAQEESKEQREEEMTCELLVRGTFISLKPVNAGVRRRTQSVPAVRRCSFA